MQSGGRAELYLGNHGRGVGKGRVGQLSVQRLWRLGPRAGHGASRGLFITYARILSIDRVPVSVVAPILLAEIYGWCTEGSDTKGLQEAKSLLEELT